MSLLHYLRYLPTREFKRYRGYLDFVREYSKGLIQKNVREQDSGTIISALLNANESKDPHTYMSEPEMIDQIS